MAMPLGAEGTTAAPHTTEPAITQPLGPMQGVAQSPMDTAAQAPGKLTTRQPAPTPAAPHTRTPMAAKAPPKHTTQEPGRMARRSKAPMPTEVGAVRPFRKMATQRTANIKRLHKEQRAR